MTNKIDLNKYSEFVLEVCSDSSKDLESFISRLKILNESCNIALLTTAYTGMASESGEFAEICKKIIFHGKEFTDDVKVHMLKELGDVAWYLINACNALNIDPNVIFSENVKKLESRYPGGKFSIERSENRSVGDI